MSGRFNLIIGSHNHIPLGMGDDEFERLYTKRLKPFVTALNNFPKIPVTLHYSGVILQWIEKAHPEFFMLIEDLSARKQVELLGGGFYEPLLPLLPSTDKLGQIEMFTTYLKKRFGKRPQGCWLPALAWEQNLVGVLNTSGMGYTFLGEEQFALAGFSFNALYSPCISEDQGKLITLFPLMTGLYGELERWGPYEVLKGLAERIPESGLISLFPRRFSWEEEPSVSGEIGINRFFEELSRAESFVDFTTPGRFYKSRRGLKKGYFPSSAQPDACLFQDTEEEGWIVTDHPRRFLINFPEANAIYSKMMFTHVLINHLRGDKIRKRTAREELWKAQGYDVFCSAEAVYRRTVRSAVYRALLSAEKITREKGSFLPSVMILDFDLDGEDEYLFQQEQINCYIKPTGALVFELDYLPRAWNYLDTLARRRFPGRTDGGSEDFSRRSAFADRLAPADQSFQNALAGMFPGSRFCAQERYDLIETDKTHGKARFRLPPRKDLPFGLIEIEKDYQLKSDTVTLRYGLVNRGERAQRFRFIPEVDLSLPGEGEGFQKILIRSVGGIREVLSSEWEAPGTESLEIHDLKNEAFLNLSAARPFTAWSFPLRTPQTGAQAGQYQSTGIMPVSDVSLESGERWETAYSLRILPSERRR
ncbi:MAG: DUF1926 domain-containing protein [Treponema sp.]|jgi:hypothetical protein|nr:DUF1926 domain-containing protein [Treponema sp.]